LVEWFWGTQPVQNSEESQKDLGLESFC
jgi:hypothetical protein